MSKKQKKVALVVLIIISFLVVSVGVYFLGGVVLLLVFKQNPMQADWYTLIDAYNSIEPGTVAAKKFKASVLVTALVGYAIPFGLLMSSRKKNQDIHGKARFANNKEIEKIGLASPKGLIIGKIGKMFLRFPGAEFLMLVSGTRSGKGVSCVVPNLLTFTDSAVVLDIKSENYNLTSEYRRQKLGQKIFYFNPFSETTHRWNPLSYISKDPHFWDSDLRALAAIIYKKDAKDNPFWPDSARNIFVGLGLLLMETPMLPRTIGEMLRQASGKGIPLKDYFEHVIKARAESDTPLSDACVDCLNRFLSNPDDTRNNIVSSFTAPLALWGNPVVDKATSADDFDLRDVRRQRMTIYICISPKVLEVADFIVNMFFSQLINENVTELPEHNPALKYQCLLLMDEFTAMGKVGIIAKGVGFMAGYNLRLLIIIQGKKQLDSTYGRDDAHTITINMGAQIFFTPSHIDDAKTYSEILGYETVTTHTAQRSNVGLLNSGTFGLNETEHLNKKALMLPQELMQMSQDTSLISRPGIPIIKSEKIRYYEDEDLMKLFFSVPTQELLIDGKLRRVPIPAVLPTQQWIYYYSLIADSGYYLEGDLEDLCAVNSGAALNDHLGIENAAGSDLSEAEREANLRALAKSWFEMSVKGLQPSEQHSENALHTERADYGRAR